MAIELGLAVLRMKKTAAYGRRGPNTIPIGHLRREPSRCYRPFFFFSALCAKPSPRRWAPLCDTSRFAFGPRPATIWFRLELHTTTITIHSVWTKKRHQTLSQTTLSFTNDGHNENLGSRRTARDTICQSLAGSILPECSTTVATFGCALAAVSRHVGVYAGMCVGPNWGWCFIKSQIELAT